MVNQSKAHLKISSDYHKFTQCDGNILQKCCDELNNIIPGPAAGFSRSPKCTVMLFAQQQVCRGCNDGAKPDKRVRFASLGWQIPCNARQSRLKAGVHYNLYRTIRGTSNTIAAKGNSNERICLVGCWLCTAVQGQDVTQKGVSTMSNSPSF